tara:strand:+ start:1525 stop:2034 length:510 start_codon:yes stop_codon:yes gene_type:complete
MAECPVNVEILVQEPAWGRLSFAVDNLIDSAVRAALLHCQFGKHCEVSVALMDDVSIERLNSQWRQKREATNVLAFPSISVAGSCETPLLLGDIVLAFETVMTEAKKFGISEAQHVTHLVVHGTLHLLGYDHISDTDALKMERLEQGILDVLGFNLFNIDQSKALDALK